MDQATSHSFLADSWQNEATRLIVGVMIRTNWKALAGGLSVYLALGLSTPAVNAATSPLSYQTLLAVDDPGKTPAAAAATSTPAVPEVETPSGLDGETPNALKPGGLETTTAPSDEELASAAKKSLDEDEPSAFKTWWFWALAAGVVGSTVALGVWAAQPSDSPARPCPAGVIACFGDGRN